MSAQHEEFPELTQPAQAAYRAGCQAGQYSPTPLTIASRQYLAAFLREAIEQAKEHGIILSVNNLLAIANNLHSLPPPPPTLAEARAADLDTPAGRDVVRDFLATLGEGEQA